MRHDLSNHLLHNPFHNRFNDPVTRREDDMQSYAYSAWLRERSLEQSGFKVPSSAHRITEFSQGTSHAGRVFAGAFAVVVVVLVSLAMLFRAI